MCMGCLPEDEANADQDNGSATISRRDLFRQSAAAVVAAAYFTPAAAQAPSQTQPLVRSGPGGVLYWGNFTGTVTGKSVLDERQGPTKTTGMKFRALVRYGNSLSTETLTLLPIHPLQVVVRAQASQTCYSTTSALTSGWGAPNALVCGHGGVGIVEEVGSMVKRVRVGDQVIVSATQNCGVCLNCLSGRGDLCSVRLPVIPAATMADRTPVYLTAPPAGPAGLSEIMLADEDWVVPVFTKVPPVELSLLSCVGAVGLGLAMCREPVQPGTDVAVFGLGPLGISAVQGARIQRAKTIIGIDPIKYRRELALKLGATHVLDPNVVRGDELINQIRALTPDVIPFGRRYTGEHPAGPTYALEAAGGTRHRLPPGIEEPLDMTGIEPLEQAWAAARSGGFVRTTSIGQPPGAKVSFGGQQWSLAAKTHMPGNFAGVVTLRDYPRFIHLIESGDYDAKSMVGRVFKADKMQEALQMSADRSAITTVVDFT